MMYYVYSFRCQPLSKLNEQEILHLSTSIGEQDKIIIGIINPNPDSISSLDAPNLWRRLLKVFNPLSFWERYIMVRKFIKRANLEDQISAIVPLLRPSLNMDYNSNFLPDKSHRKMCISLVYENVEYEQKYDGLISQNEDIHIIESQIDWLNKVFSPELFFGLMGSNDKRWEYFVDGEVKEYLLQINIFNRVISAFNDDTAHTPISGIKKSYNNITDIYDKNLFKEEFESYLGVSKQSITYEVSERAVEDFLELLNTLYFDMSEKISAYEHYAPSQYQIFCELLSKLQNIRDYKKVQLMRDEALFNNSKAYYSECNKIWQTREKAS